MVMPRPVHARWLGLLLTLGCGPVLAQDAAAAPQGTKIHMHGSESGYAADGYLFQPMGAGPFAAVLLIPDRGIADFMRVAAQSLLEMESR